MSIPNQPTPEGRKMGIQLARMTDLEVAKLIADGEWATDERCSSCAFRLFTFPNGCPETVMDATKCVLEHKVFYCHMKEPIGVQPCMGWFAAAQKRGHKNPPIECPWPFSTPATD